MTAVTPTPSVYSDARALPRLCWVAAHRAARCGRDGTTHGPEEAAFTSAWIMVGLDPARRWACQSLGMLAGGCRLYRAGVTIGRFMREACLRHHGRDKAAWVIRTLTRGNVGPASRLPDHVGKVPGDNLPLAA